MESNNDKLEKAKKYLGRKWVLHPDNPNRIQNNKKGVTCLMKKKA